MLKKTLMYGGGAVVAYLIYKQMTKPTATAASKLAAPLTQTFAAPTRASQTAQRQDAVAGLLQELGLEESLGSLGGAYK
jgi:hypothetical protein